MSGQERKGGGRGKRKPGGGEGEEVQGRSDLLEMIESEHQWRQINHLSGEQEDGEGGRGALVRVPLVIALAAAPRLVGVHIRCQSLLCQATGCFFSEVAAIVQATC